MLPAILCCHPEISQSMSCVQRHPKGAFRWLTLTPSPSPELKKRVLWTWTWRDAPAGCSQLLYLYLSFVFVAALPLTSVILPGIPWCCVDMVRYLKNIHVSSTGVVYTVNNSFSFEKITVHYP